MYTDIEAVSSMGAAAKWPVCVANGWLHQLSSLILNQIIPRNGRLDYSCVWGVKDGWGWEFTSTILSPSFICVCVCVCVFILNVTCHSTLPYLTYHISISDIKI